MPTPKKPTNALLVHQHATISHLRERLELLWSLAQQHTQGVDSEVIGRRFKITQAQLKRCLAEHRRFAKYVYIAQRMEHRGTGARMKGDAATWAKFMQDVKKQDKFAASAAGLKKTLAQDPRAATMRKALHLYYVIDGVVHGGWKPIAKPNALIGKVKIATP